MSSYGINLSFENLGKIVNALLVFTIFLIVSCKTIRPAGISEDASPFTLVQIKTDTIYSSPQIISLLHLPLKTLKSSSLVLAYSEAELVKTSVFAERNKAIAAINGGFFNVTKGGSVTYLEIQDSMVNKLATADGRWSKPDSVLNGAIVIEKKGKLLIETSRTPEQYHTSKQEAAVLVTGPLLISGSKPVKLPSTNLINLRHPRTCICTTDSEVVFIVIDGRSTQAAGMNLHETQRYLLNLGCMFAINLDGGGSSTLWTRSRGIVNNPSDKTGERPVANALLIVKK